MKIIRHIALVSGLTVFTGTAGAVPVIYNPGTLSFSSSGQDMWGPGGAALPVTSQFSTRWDSSSRIGGIAGSSRELIVPELTIQDWHPGYSHDHGYTESHTSHFFHNHATGIGSDSRYSEWHANLQWHNGYSETHVVSEAQYADTRTGVEALLSTQGSLELTSSLGFNGGSVDAAVDYDTSLVLPDTLAVGEFFSFNPNSAIGDVSLDTQFPELTGRVSASLSASIDATTTSCIVFAGCTSNRASLLNIDPTDMNILKINTSDLPDDKMSVFGLDDLAFDVTRGTIFTDIVIEPGAIIRPVITLPFMTPPLAVGINLGDVTLDYPDFETSGALNGEKIVASNSVDSIVDYRVDVDALASLYGVPPLGAVAYVQPLTFRGDIIDINLGPTMDLSQDFELEPILMVDLSFDHAVLSQSGENITSWSGAYSDIPRFALHDEHGVEVTPTYWLSATLLNKTLLDFNVDFSLEVLRGTIDLSVIRIAEFVLEEQEFSTWAGTENVFESSFDFGGFERIVGDSFFLSAATGGRIGALGSGTGNSVPEPATLPLFALGYILLSRYSRRRVRKYR